jgi:integrase
MPRKKHWSRNIEESGVQVRIYERANSSSLWYSVTRNGTKHRKSLKTTDRVLAQSRAEALANKLALATLTGDDLRSPTLGHIFELYRQEKLPLLSEDRAKLATTHLDLFTRAWGENFEVSNLSPSHVARFVADRRSGALAPSFKGREPAGVRDGTIDGDFRWLRSVFNFARRHRVSGRSAIPSNPLEDLTWPKEKNPQKPIASHERYTRTQEHTDTVDPKGRLRCILALARLTGRRESAICGLRTNDVLRDDAAVAKELAGAGMDERIAGHMPHGAIRWSDETDKEGFLFIAPLSEQARAEVDRYLRKSPRVGDVPLFPAVKNGVKAIRRDVAARLLLKAEKRAELPKLQRGVFHPYRRLWASERKALPSKDVAHAGGWKDVETMLGSYVQSDAATVLRVVENA